MAQVQIEISDEEHERFLRQAEQDGLSLSEWMAKAAHLHLKSLGLLNEQKYKYGEPFKSVEELEAFFRAIDERQTSSEPEPDWEEHKKVIHEGKMASWTGT